VILVSCQSSSTGERLLTVSVRTFVGSLARMYSSMPRQGAGVAERLKGNVSEEKHEVTILIIPFHISHTYEVSHRCVLVHVLSRLISE
jgi:hypothetical protein